jgi:hypothetical protein
MKNRYEFPKFIPRVGDVVQIQQHTTIFEIKVVFRAKSLPNDESYVIHTSINNDKDYPRVLKYENGSWEIQYVGGTSERVSLFIL